MPSFGLGRTRESKKEPKEDEDWYIPYNGPYEEPPKKYKARDSWGEPLGDDGSGDEDEDETRELHLRYGGHNDFQYGGRGSIFGDRKGSHDKERTRGRSMSREPPFSVVSGRTTSSGALDPTRTSFATTQRRSTLSSVAAPPVPSYISLDARGGGVGESPIPHIRPPKDANRISLASIFTFGGRRTTASPARSIESAPERKRDRGYSSPSRRGVPEKAVRRVESPAPSKNGARTESPAPRTSNSSSSDNHRYLRQAHQTPVILATSHNASTNKHEHLRHQTAQQADRFNSVATEEDDYYNSYYSTLLDKPDDSANGHSLQQPHQIQHSPPSTGSQRSSLQHDPPQVGVSRQNSTSTTSGHPYALAISQSEHDDSDDVDECLQDPPQATAVYQPTHPYNQPSTSSYSHHPYNQPAIMNHNAPKLTFSTTLPSSADAANTAFSPRGMGVGSLGLGLGLGKSLKNSSSTPNLRLSQVGAPAGVAFDSNVGIITAGQQQRQMQVAPPTFVFPKGKDRWLSAETWCDALLFPRPRLKLKQDRAIEPASPRGGLPSPASGRIVSPPDSPLGEDFAFGAGGSSTEGQIRQQRQPGIASRVLAHSRSLVDLKEKAKAKDEYPDVIPVQRVGQDPQGSKLTAVQLHARLNTERPPRPKSFAQDDLALPPPVPSLAHVLKEGQLLESERRAWQLQATKSFGNKRARSVSRTRSKSLTRKGRKGHMPQSSMEYLTAQACLGSQNAALTPSIVPPKLSIFGPPSGSGTATTTTASAERTSHSHSNSLAKTFSKTSKSHSRTDSRSHSRNESWGKITVAKICGDLGMDVEDDSSQVQLGAPLQGHKTSDLEKALKRDGTKVIRLADPAHIPLDQGQPLSAVQQTQSQYQRQTPSPAVSGISESRVGIALGTPSDDLGPLGAATMSYMPSHPYAQGGFSFVPTSIGHAADFAGPHPSLLNSTTKVPGISEILAKHKLPPHIGMHPYASAAGFGNDVENKHRLVRDSYLDANGLIGHYRSENGPHPSKMWAQLSPGAVREILPGDFQYSPYMSEIGHGDKDEDDIGKRSKRHAISIHDTAGVAEALVNAARLNEGEEQLKGQQSHMGGRDEGRRPEIGPPARPVRLEETYKLSDPSSNHTYASSPLESLPIPFRDRPYSNSPAWTLESSSPPLSPRPLGSPHDLDSFQDLFYRPGQSRHQQTPIEASLPETPSPPNAAQMPWDMRTRRTASGLTSLAQQLSEEFEAIAQGRAERIDSQYSHSRSQSLTSSSQRPSGLSRRPTETDSSLQFVFEEMAHVASSPPTSINLDDTINTFRPSGNLPEDVESSRASSLIENIDDEDDDPTAIFRVGIVESVSTPPAVDSERRLSFNGQTVNSEESVAHPLRHHISSDDSRLHNYDPRQVGVRFSGSPKSHDRILSGLHPPLTEATRSSYMTTSTFSRMSNLSDFPTPPKASQAENMSMSSSGGKHMSFLSSYFDEAFRSREDLPPPPSLPGGTNTTPSSNSTRPDSGVHRADVTFGDNQDADDVAKILSTTSSSRF